MAPPPPAALVSRVLTQPEDITHKTGSPATAAQSTHRMPLSFPLDQLTHMHGYMHALFCRLGRAPGGILYSLITKL